jgi:hypothetical protein
MAKVNHVDRSTMQRAHALMMVYAEKGNHITQQRAVEIIQAQDRAMDDDVQREGKALIHLPRKTIKTYRKVRSDTTKARARRAESAAKREANRLRRIANRSVCPSLKAKAMREGASEEQQRKAEAAARKAAEEKMKELGF